MGYRSKTMVHGRCVWPHCPKKRQGKNVFCPKHSKSATSMTDRHYAKQRKVRDRIVRAAKVAGNGKRRRPPGAIK